MSINVRITDITNIDYRFRPLAEFNDLWTIIPRVGEYIYDGNEMKYKVVEVAWFGPYMATMNVERER